MKRSSRDPDLERLRSMLYLYWNASVRMQENQTLGVQDLDAIFFELLDEVEKIGER